MSEEISELHDELHPEYDLATLLKGGIRGKYAERYRKGMNLMKVYQVECIRHHTVAFGGTPEEAVANALAGGEVGDWEYPEAREISLPAGFALRPERQSAEWLAFALKEAWDGLRRRLDGLTDEEFFWEPVADCWTVHPDENGRWVLDYVYPNPNPGPFTTIAWRLVHIGTCKIMYYEYAFGPGLLTWDEMEVDVPHTAADVITWLEESHGRLQTALSGLNDAELAEMRPTNWGEQWPTWRIFWAMASHDLQHGAEIGCLRDLYRVYRATSSDDTLSIKK